jgi:hypothetical protein
MKKLIKSMILATVILSFSTIVSANSGPIFWQGYPSSDVMSIDADSPIAVKNENLVFDFSDYNDADLTICGKVTATYKMVNPTEETQLVQMAFPYVEALKSLSPESIVITADDIIIPYDIYFGEVVEIRGNPRYEKETIFDFANIVNAISAEPYSAKSFEEYERGRLYTLDIKPIANQVINIVVNFNSSKTKVFATGFNAYEQNNGRIKITASCHRPETIEFFVLGDDIALLTNTFTAGKPKGETDLSNCQIETKNLEFKPYFMDYIKKRTNPSTRSMTSNTQLYNLYAKALDKYFKANMGYCSDYDFMEQEEYKRIMTLVYTVQFPKNSEKKISVSYKTSGTMDKTETAKPLYSFDYILNPAENWKNFKNLNIEVITPKEAPYIVKSSVNFIKGENKIYTAILPTLPKEDLSFTLYADKKITLLDKTVGNFQSSFGYLTLLIIGAFVFLIRIIIVVFLKKSK